MILYGPREPEQRQGHKDSADVGERETELGFGDVFVARGQGVVNGINVRDEE